MIRAALLATLLAAPAAADGALPFAVGGAFALTDQSGAPRTEADPAGRGQLLFFGYANCQQICSAALPLMADIADALARAGTPVTPVMITVDPARDTVAAIGPPLERLHEGFVGLTGDAAALQVAYDAYSVEREHLFDDPEHGPVYAHGSFIYVLDAAGTVRTLIPPILPPDEAARIAARHLAAEAG